MKYFSLFIYSLLLPLFTIKAEETVHRFAGKHFLASYLHCDQKAIANLEALLNAMDTAVQASGATILDRSFHVFPPNGLTVIYMLSESHASLHTYPEIGACFVDLFTCGDNCSPTPFNQILQAYLQPAQVNARQFIRHESIEEVPVDNFSDNQK